MKQPLKFLNISAVIRFLDQSLRKGLIELCFAAFLSTLLLTQGLYAQNINFQIQVNVPQQLPPDLYRLQTDPIMFIDLFSDANQPYQLIVEVVAEEMDLGEVFRASSHPREVPDGMWNETIDNTVFMTEADPNMSGMTSFARLDFNPDFETQLMQFGILPDGIYMICVYAYLADDMTLLAQGCNNTMIELPGPPNQISPVACENTSVENVLFTWTPVQRDGPVSYRISIFQVLPGQYLMDALLNVPFAQDEVFDQPNYIYASVNLPLEGGQYAWTVEAFDELGNVFTDPPANEPECFYFDPPSLGAGSSFVDVIDPAGDCSGPAEVLSVAGPEDISININFNGNFDRIAVLAKPDDGSDFLPELPANLDADLIEYSDRAITDNFGPSMSSVDMLLPGLKPETPTVYRISAFGIVNQNGQDIAIAGGTVSCINIVPDTISNPGNSPDDVSNPDDNGDERVKHW